MALLNYSTKVDAHKTVGEIQALLSKKGAASVMVLYENGNPEAVSFRFEINHNEVPFKLPCKFEGVRKVMLAGVAGRLAKSRREKDPEFARQVRRVSWRIIKDWIEAQLALVDAGHAEITEVFLPYVVSNNGVTLWETFRDNSGFMLDGMNQRALPAPKDT